MADREYMEKKYRLTDYMEKKVIGQVLTFVHNNDRFPTCREINLNEQIECNYLHICYHFEGMENLKEKVKKHL